MNKKAVILLSGGLDSATCLAIAKSQGFDCYALSFEYGQKHIAEIEASKRIAKSIGVLKHQSIKLELEQICHSALTSSTISIPDFKNNNEIPVTYVPARNTIFLSLALGWAESLGALDIFIGANAIDYSGYPDCRPLFFEAFQSIANIATKQGIEQSPFRIQTPILKLSKKEIIQWGIKLGVDYSLTVSCYRANSQGKACGRCDSCVLRQQGFNAAGVDDPTQYQEQSIHHND